MKLGAYLRERLRRPIRVESFSVTKLELVVLAAFIGLVLAGTVRGWFAIMEDLLWVARRLGL